jgi:PKHD-type hydroxylase
MTEQHLPKGPSIELVPNEYLCIPSSSHRYFSVDECQKIISLCANMPFRSGDILENPSKESPSVRKTDITRLVPDNNTLWIYEKIMRVVSGMNKYYQYDISTIEPIQIGRYAEGGFYNWHMDIGMGGASLRKLSVTVQLSETHAYEGGELQFRNFKLNESLKDIGSMIVFPSYLLHRVTPVTKGERWSLVAWILGRPFR